MKTDNVGSTTAITTSQVQHPIKKQGLLTRWMRFLGFNSVKVVTVTKHIPSIKAESLPATKKEHTVVRLAEDFQGFRCNRKHLAMLEQRLVNAPELQHGRSEQNRQSKVRLAMVAAGMATLAGNDPVEVIPVQRYLIQPELKARQFELLNHWLNSGDADLLKSFGQKGAEMAITWPLPEVAPFELGMVAGVDNIDDDVDKIIRFRQCRDYLLHGEGAELTKELPVQPHLDALLPDISEACLAPDVNQHLATARLKTGKPVGTSEETFNSYNAEAGIVMRTPPIIQTYDPQDRYMRALTIIEELKHCYRGLCTAAKTLYSITSEDTENYTKFNKLSQDSQFVLNGVSHALMRKAWPTVFSDHLYQQLIMPSLEDAGITRWNSDSPAPRGEWMHDRDFKQYLDSPVT